MIEFKTDETRRSESQDRKQALRDAGRCINGTLTGEPSKRTGTIHGPVVSGGKCARCIAIHRGDQP